MTDIRIHELLYPSSLGTEPSPLASSSAAVSQIENASSSASLADPSKESKIQTVFNGLQALLMFSIHMEHVPSPDLMSSRQKWEKRYDDYKEEVSQGTSASSLELPDELEKDGLFLEHISHREYQGMKTTMLHLVENVRLFIQDTEPNVEVKDDVKLDSQVHQEGSADSYEAKEDEEEHWLVVKSLQLAGPAFDMVRAGRAGEEYRDFEFTPYPLVAAALCLKRSSGINSEFLPDLLSMKLPAAFCTLPLPKENFCTGLPVLVLLFLPSFLLLLYALSPIY